MPEDPVSQLTQDSEWTEITGWLFGLLIYQLHCLAFAHPPRRAMAQPRRHVQLNATLTLPSATLLRLPARASPALPDARRPTTCTWYCDCLWLTGTTDDR